MMKVEIRNLGQTDFRCIHGGEEITLSPGDHCILTTLEITVSEPVAPVVELAETATVSHEIPDFVEPEQPEVNHES